jgi:CDP-diacylglycerol pyrophosphatase
MCHLHIHIDCVGAGARDALKSQSVRSEWVRLTRLPAFVAKRFDESQFKEMAREAIQVTERHETLASRTIVLVPAPDHGVYLLRSHHGPGGSGAGEALLESRCDAIEAQP